MITQSDGAKYKIKNNSYFSNSKRLIIVSALSINYPRSGCYCVQHYLLNVTHSPTPLLHVQFHMNRWIMWSWFNYCFMTCRAIIDFNNTVIAQFYDDSHNAYDDSAFRLSFIVTVWTEKLKCWHPWKIIWISVIRYFTKQLNDNKEYFCAQSWSRIHICKTVWSYCGKIIDA